MNNFLQISAGVDVTPVLLAIKRRPWLWNQVPLRTQFPGSPHTAVDDILLRFNEIPPPGEEARVVDDCECIDFPAYGHLPECRKIVRDLMAFVAGERLGRVMVTRLKPNGIIARHADSGAPASYYDRFHIPLQSAAGIGFTCGDERVCMAAGTVWWVDNTVEHEVQNNSLVDRLHLIVDIRLSQ